MVRLTIEAVGALLIIAAFALVDVVLGLLVAGVLLVLIANFYIKGAPDAGPGEHDQTDS